MIRHVLLVRCNRDATPERIDEIRARLAGLDCPGRTRFTMGTDLGLRPGNMDFAMVADFADVEAFAAYERDAEHDVIRRELVAPIAERSERCQFEL
ncbi:MAG: Dabb family protein [Actinomycetota bacterium]|nr:Dabb family protein [Actinomycetota bacterium]